MSIYGESDGGEGLTAPAAPKAGGPGVVAQAQAWWQSLDEKQHKTIMGVGAVLVLGLILYMIFGGSSSAAETWTGTEVTLLSTTGGACASGTSEGIGTHAVSTSSASSGEASCGPCMVPNADVNTQVHCNRDYTFGQGYQSFFTEYAGRQLTLIQDAHDPNDINWDRTGVVDPTTMHSSTLFAIVTIPAGAEATFHCFVPVGCQAEHAHTPNEYPNMVDPQGGWTESSESYMEDNGIERRRFFKKVTANGDNAIEYPLHHTIHKGWGYVYLVELQKAGYCPVHTPPANRIIVTDLHAGHACGPIVIPYPSTCTEVHCDRHYQFGNWGQSQYRSWNNDFFKPSNEPTRRRNLWLIQDAHDPNDVADLTSIVDANTGLVNQQSAGSVTTCAGGRSECKFVRVHIPNGYTAVVHAFVPLDMNCMVAPPPPAPVYGQTDGYHAHTNEDLPNSIDPAGGWADTYECFSEDPGWHTRTGHCTTPIGVTSSCAYGQPGQIMSRAQCQEQCDTDPSCVAFDIESHTEYGQTEGQCCFYRYTGGPNIPAPDVDGDDTPTVHCVVKGSGENADRSVRPRAHWTKAINPNTAGVIRENPVPGITMESTGLNTEHLGGHYAYDLYHTVHTNWGYVYIVELCGGAGGNQCGSSYGR